ncbi:MAG: hypothetical protein U0838_11450 [Chloroflexota bacterium]
MALSYATPPPCRFPPRNRRIAASSRVAILGIDHLVIAVRDPDRRRR